MSNTILPSNMEELSKFIIKGGFTHHYDSNYIDFALIDKINDWIIENISWLPIRIHYTTADESFIEFLISANMVWHFASDDRHYSAFKHAMKERNLL